MSDELVFRFKLPADGLALRSMALVKGVPELHFDISPKVPTITEQDVATAIRLASENKRPEFFLHSCPFESSILWQACNISIIHHGGCVILP